MIRADQFRAKASHFRQLALAARHPESRNALLLLADEYELEASALDSPAEPPPAPVPEPPIAG